MINKLALFIGSAVMISTALLIHSDAQLAVGLGIGWIAISIKFE